MTELLKNHILPSLLYNPQRPLLFNSTFFMFFFLMIVLIYPFLAKKANLRTWFLLLVSLFFYYKTSGGFVLMLILTAFINFQLGRLVWLSKKPHWRNFLFILCVSWNLGSLGYYKYSNFIINTINQISGGNLPLLDIFLPVGISFFTFQTMSYSIDIFMRKLEPIESFKDFLFFVSFFPHLVAGPIVRASFFIPQIKQKIHLDNALVTRALILIMGGLIKKCVIADYLSINFVDRVFDNPTLFSGVENLLGIYAYALQIYCDFSGYSDMAIGLALLLGYTLPQNFDSPYMSRSVTEFWRRWHMSLSTWLRDYIYIPLGGNRKGKARQYANLMTTMVLGGLWHGASWNFVFWGTLHGVGLMIDKLWLGLKISQNRFIQFISLIITFHFVCFGWIFFRTPNFAFAWQMLTQIFTNFNAGLLMEWVKGYYLIAALIAFGYLTHWMPRKMELTIQRVMNYLPIPLQSVAAALVIWVVFQAKTSDIQPFIYFQF